MVTIGGGGGGGASSYWMPTGLQIFIVIFIGDAVEGQEKGCMQTGEGPWKGTVFGHLLQRESKQIYHL